MSNRTTLLKSLSTNILLFQRTMRFARLSLPPLKDLEALETITFTFIDSLLNPTASDLQRILGLNKSSVSSLIRNSIDRGLIEAQLGVINHRSKFLTFTSGSEEVVRKLRDFNIEVARKGTVRLTDNQRKKLASYMEELNSGLGYDLEDKWDSREPIVRAQYRLALVMDMLNKNYMGSKYDLCTFHAFLELDKDSTGLEFSHLTNILPFHVSKISRAITDLQKKKFVKKEISDKDARQIRVFLTDSGKKEFESINKPIMKKLDLASKGLKDEELEELNLLLKLVGDETETYTNKSLSQITICKSEGDYRNARAFLLEKLVETKSHLYLDEHILPKSSLVVLETREGKPLSLLEMRFKEGELMIEHLILNKSSKEDIKKVLLSEARRVLMKEMG